MFIICVFKLHSTITELIKQLVTNTGIHQWHGKHWRMLGPSLPVQLYRVHPN